MTANSHEFRNALTFGSDEERLSVLRQMRDDISDDGEPSWFFDLAREQITSKNNDIRWQSLIVIGEYIPFGRRNEEIWNVIMQFCGYDEDMQDALATVLLEHLLEYDFDATVDRIRVALREGVRNVIHLLELCSRFDQPEANWQQIQRIIGDNSVRGTRTN